MDLHSQRSMGRFLEKLQSVLYGWVAADPDALVPQADSAVFSPQAWIGISRLLPVYRLLLSAFHNPLFRASMVLGVVTGGLGCGLWVLSRRSERAAEADAAATDPSLLKKHSKTRSYTVPSSGFTYPGIRTFFRPHPDQTKFPAKPSPLPLLVFIHGLGGSTAQFHPLLESLVHLAGCLAIDLPGCGTSTFEPKRWDAYTTESLVRLLAVVIEEHRDSEAGQGVILIGHSMGCSLAALLASSTSPFKDLLSEHVIGLIAICPKAEPMDAQQQRALKIATSIPSPLFDIIRRFDRRKGTKSASVLRLTGPNADEQTKKMQLRFNHQSRTSVWRRMSRGMLPGSSIGNYRGGLPGRETWSGLEIPLFLAGGDADALTPPENLHKILGFLGKAVPATPNESTDAEKGGIPVAAAPIDPAIMDPPLLDEKHHDQANDTSEPELLSASGSTASLFTDESDNVHVEDLSPSYGTVLLDASYSVSSSESASSGKDIPSDKEEEADPRSPESSNPQPLQRRLVVKTHILPTPAAHTLPFATSCSRTLSGLVTSFLFTHIDPRLSLGWQMHYLNKEGKWDVKNLAKWTAVQPVSHPIGHTFRAMKTLREVDEQHSPKIFVSEWKNKIGCVVDISHDQPVYDNAGLEAGGIAYYKFPTVSKLPPTKEEVQDFIALVDRIRGELGLGGEGSPLIGVHCHYGFNRTGFFLVCYMVERLGYRLEDAIQEFAEARKPGIRHGHFIDTLYVRYCKGLKRAPTL